MEAFGGFTLPTAAPPPPPRLDLTPPPPLPSLDLTPPPQLPSIEDDQPYGSPPPSSPELTLDNAFGGISAATLNLRNSGRPAATNEADAPEGAFELDLEGLDADQSGSAQEGGGIMAQTAMDAVGATPVIPLAGFVEVTSEDLGAPLQHQPPSQQPAAGQLAGASAKKSDNFDAQWWKETEGLEIGPLLDASAAAMPEPSAAPSSLAPAPRQRNALSTFSAPAPPVASPAPFEASAAASSRAMPSSSAAAPSMQYASASLAGKSDAEIRSMSAAIASEAAEAEARAARKDPAAVEAAAMNAQMLFEIYGPWAGADDASAQVRNAINISALTDYLIARGPQASAELPSAMQLSAIEGDTVLQAMVDLRALDPLRMVLVGPQPFLMLAGAQLVALSSIEAQHAQQMLSQPRAKPAPKKRKMSIHLIKSLRTAQLHSEGARVKTTHYQPRHATRRNIGGGDLGMQMKDASAIMRALTPEEREIVEAAAQAKYDVGVSAPQLKRVLASRQTATQRQRVREMRRRNRELSQEDPDYGAHAPLADEPSPPAAPSWAPPFGQLPALPAAVMSSNFGLLTAPPLFAAPILGEAPPPYPSAAPALMGHAPLILPAAPALMGHAPLILPDAAHTPLQPQLPVMPALVGHTPLHLPSGQRALSMPPTSSPAAPPALLAPPAEAEEEDEEDAAEAQAGEALRQQLLDAQLPPLEALDAAEAAADRDLAELEAGTELSSEVLNAVNAAEPPTEFAPGQEEDI